MALIRGLGPYVWARFRATRAASGLLKVFGSASVSTFAVVSPSFSSSSLKSEPDDDEESFFFFFFFSFVVSLNITVFAFFIFCSFSEIFFFASSSSA